MSALGTVRKSIEVAVGPDTAFEVFTSEIDAWYRSTPYSWINPAKAVGLRLEPGVGGRLVEVWDDGDNIEWARVSVWEPGHRLIFDWLHEGGHQTEVEISFVPVGDDGTRVTIEHRGWDRLPMEVAAKLMSKVSKGWPAMLRWYAEHLAHSRGGSGR